MSLERPDDLDIEKELEKLFAAFNSGRRINILPSFYWKLMRSEAFKAMLQRYETRPTAAAREERFVSPEQLKVIDEKIEQLRNWLFHEDNGQKFITHPDYQEWVEAQHRSEEEFKKFFWRKDSEFEIMADLEEPSEEAVHPLRLGVTWDRSEKESVSINFDFSGRFEFTDEFSGPEGSPEERSLVYRSSLLPLDCMTQEEADMIEESLDTYTRQVVAFV